MLKCHTCSIIELGHCFSAEQAKEFKINCGPLKSLACYRLSALQRQGPCGMPGVTEESVGKNSVALRNFHQEEVEHWKKVFAENE